ncbi:MAG TPA: Gfo/Idh/MocA family oxidoreductase [Nitrospiria bacterium]|nr:Gfo/Idh/MocA family oxidoreductase [Candidatus Manganitrophaceae bacterium]
MKDFALIGAAGYIAPRHMKAIKETGNNLVAALDRNDSVGIMDRYFPEADFFTEFERFDRHIDLLNRQGDKIYCVSIVSPNYLHDSHIRYALRSGAHAICEKPLVVNPWNIESLKELEQDTGKSVFSILQLRLHPSIVALKASVVSELSKNPKKVFDVDLTYLTSRGHWYFSSWKGDEKKSGGIVANLGVHFFDMLSWVFGDLKRNIVHILQDNVASGFLEFQHARVRWFLSLKYEYIPDDLKALGKRTYRAITVDGEEVEFSNGFSDLHTASYQHILSGQGFGLEDALPSVELVHLIRTSTVVGLKGDYHPFAATVSK